ALAPSFDGEQLPFLGDAFQRVRSPVDERQPGTHDEIAHRPRAQHLAGLGLPHHAGADVHGDPADVVSAAFDLADVQPGADVDADTPQQHAELRCGADRAAGTIEGGERAVARRLHDPASETLQVGPCDVVVLIEQL